MTANEYTIGTDDLVMKVKPMLNLFLQLLVVNFPKGDLPVEAFMISLVTDSNDVQ